ESSLPTSVRSFLARFRRTPSKPTPWRKPAGARQRFTPPTQTTERAADGRQEERARDGLHRRGAQEEQERPVLRSRRASAQAQSEDLSDHVWSREGATRPRAGVEIGRASC